MSDEVGKWSEELEGLLAESLVRKNEGDRRRAEQERLERESQEATERATRAEIAARGAKNAELALLAREMLEALSAREILAAAQAQCTHRDLPSEYTGPFGPSCSERTCRVSLSYQVMRDIGVGELVRNELCLQSVGVSVLANSTDELIISFHGPISPWLWQGTLNDASVISRQFRRITANWFASHSPDYSRPERSRGGRLIESDSDTTHDEIARAADLLQIERFFHGVRDRFLTATYHRTYPYGTILMGEDPSLAATRMPFERGFYTMAATVPLTSTSIVRQSDTGDVETRQEHPHEVRIGLQIQPGSSETSGGLIVSPVLAHSDRWRDGYPRRAAPAVTKWMLTTFEADEIEFVRRGVESALLLWIQAHSPTDIDHGRYSEWQKALSVEQSPTHKKRSSRWWPFQSRS